jgi:hypothetical protein
MPRVLLVEDHRAFGEALAFLLDREPAESGEDQPLVLVEGSSLELLLCLPRPVGPQGFHGRAANADGAPHLGVLELGDDQPLTVARPLALAAHA